jgi:hypothetical protein
MSPKGQKAVFEGSSVGKRPDRGPSGTAQLETTPLDVTTLGERDVECRRWLATVISDAATVYRVERARTRLRCDALAVDRAALRHKYAQSPRVLQSIDVGP